MSTPYTQDAAAVYQDVILPQVSRTFALTIPQLPAALRSAVTNAYLLCRIADTIEDEPALSAEDKHRYENAFFDVVIGKSDPQSLAAELTPRLSSGTLEAEHDLIRQLPLVIEITQRLKPAQRNAIVNCLKIMSHGMYEFQRNASVRGLPTLQDMDHYCYCVAGVVGEMLTELFVDFEPALAPHRNTMLHLAVSFGQGLQMTNILKDQWEDRAHGICWLPQEVFSKYGIDLATLAPASDNNAQNENYAQALDELIGVAHAHLRNALEYTLLIPSKHAGVRRFCLWAIGLALPTLTNLHRHPNFSAGVQVKIPRSTVARTILITNVTSRCNTVLRWLFKLAARQLPLTPLSSEWQKSAATAPVWPKAPSYLSESQGH